MSHLRRKWESIAALPDVAQTQRRATAKHTCPESKRVALQGASSYLRDANANVFEQISLWSYRDVCMARSARDAFLTNNVKVACAEKA